MESIEPENLTGKIKAIYCEHFVTYKKVEYIPSTKLNVIIGANGTGKSTLVAAIVLGLGGDPKLLARASSITDYIKNGYTEATITVQIHKNNEGAVLILTRIISRKANGAFKVDGKDVPKKVFLATVANFNIQINNLCQFLPQDRVQEFAKMSAKETLNNTLLSVCDAALISNFDKLKELQNKRNDLKEIIVKDHKKLADLQKRIEDLQNTLERYYERKKFMEKMEQCTAKKNWLEVFCIEEKTKEIDTDLKMAKDRLHAANKTFNNVVASQHKITSTKARLAEEIESQKHQVLKFTKDFDGIGNRIDELIRKIEEAKIIHQNKKHEIANSQKELEHAVSLLNATQSDLIICESALGSEIQRKEKLVEYDHQLDELKTENIQHKNLIDVLNLKIDNEIPEKQHIKSELEKSKNAFERNFQKLQNKFPDLHAAVQWLKGNEKLFAGKIYYPMLLELKVRDPSHAKYFENTIALKDLLVFTCEEKQDVSTLINHLCVQQKLQVNVCHSAAAEECNYKPSESIKNLRKFGFTSYLIDLVTGPPPLLNYLCSLYNLHNIPIGTESVNKWTDHIPIQFRQFYGGNQRYLISVSRYSRESSLMKTYISDKNLMLSEDPNEITRLEKRLSEIVRKTDALNNERSAIQAKYHETVTKRTAVLNDKRAFEAKVNRYESARSSYQRQQQTVATLKKMTLSYSDVKSTFLNTVQQCLVEMRGLKRRQVQIGDARKDHKILQEIAQNKKHIFETETEIITYALLEATAKKRELEDLVNTVEISLRNTERKYVEKLAAAKSMTNDSSPKDKNFPYIREFAELPNDIDGLEDAINECSGRLECMQSVDPQVVQELNRKISELNELKTFIENKKANEENIDGEVKSIYENWIVQLNSLIESINENFSNFMTTMNYVGEVVLSKANDNDFSSYGIEIRVQYRRNTPLQALDACVQSGGERAVAIAVYTLSLQHITHVPFRCVDELNQGMDPINERKIFDMLLQETSKPGRSQYFFVTPKLIKDMPSNASLFIYVVHNGEIDH